MPTPGRPPISQPPRGHVSSNPGAVPALQLLNNAEGGTNGTTVTQGSGGNTGGVSGNYFDAVNLGSGAALAFDNTHAAHGTLAYKVSTGVSSVTSYLQWSTQMGTQAKVYFRVYLYLTANPSSNLQIVRFQQGATLCGAFRINTTGTISAINSANASINATTAAVPLNQWFRVEGFLAGSASLGQTEIRLFSTADAQVPTEIKTSAATQATLGPVDTVRFGLAGAAASIGPFWFDDVGLSNTGYLGPASLVAAPSRGQPESPVAAQIPKSPRQRGRVFTNTPSGAPVNNPTAGPVFRQAVQPAQARRPLPPRGRTYGNPGALAALLLTNSFEGGTNGVTITTGNSGGASGNAFGSVGAPPSGGTLAYDSTLAAHGGLSAKLATAATAGTVSIKWTQNKTGNNGTGNQAKLWFRLYAYFTANPSTATQLFRTFGGDFGAGGSQQAGGQLFVLTTGALQFQNGAGTGQITSNSLIPLNSWFRVEGFVSANPGVSTGQVSFSLFWPLDSQTAVETQTSSTSAANIRGPFTEVDFGVATNTANIGPFWLDDIGVSNTGYLGPVSLEAAPSRGQPESPVAPQIPNGLRQRGRVASNAGAPVRNPTAGAVFQQATAPVRARLPQLQPRAGRAQGSAGAPVQNPTVGPPVYAPLGPVRARLPRLQPRAGRISSGPGNPVTNPVPAPALHCPVRAKPPLPPRGRISSGPGTPAHNPGAGPPFQQATAPIRVRFPLLHPRAGRAAGNAGAPIANPTAGPVFRQATGPIRARIPQNWSKGRATGNIGAPVQNPATAQFAQLHKAVRAQPAVFLKGRARGNPGTPPPPPSVGPKFYPLNHPAGNAYRAPGPFRKGRARGNAGAPVLNPAPVLTPGIVTISATGTVTAITPSGGLAATVTAAPAAAGAVTVTIEPAGPLAATVMTAPAAPGGAMVTVGGRGGEPGLAAGQLASEVQAPAGPPAPLTIPADALAPLPAAEQFTAEADGAPAH